jgi:hypothetical protein
METVKNSFVTLSNNKYASNVMEKIVKNCSQTHRELITDFICDNRDKEFIFYFRVGVY